MFITMVTVGVRLVFGWLVFMLRYLYHFRCHCMVSVHADVLPFLVLASVSLDDGVAPLILQLLQCALCGSKAVTEQTKSGSTGPAAGSSTASGSAASSVSPARSKKEEKSESKSSSDVKKKEGEPRCNMV